MEAQVREVLRRVLVDDEFLDEMLSDPEQALREYDLTDEERSILGSRERDLLELMRISGEGRQFTFLFLNFIITLEIDLTEFITTLHIDLNIDLTEPDVQRRQAFYRDKIDSLATSVLAMRSGADRLERIQEMLREVSGATELARRSRGQQSDDNS
jgi:hypothetical protein